MDRYLSIFLLIFLFGALAYSTYSFAQGRFLEGMSIFPMLIAFYLFMRVLERRQKNDE